MKKQWSFGLIGAALVFKFAAAQPLLPPAPEPAEAPPKPLVAAVSAPKEVCLGNSNGFTVRVAVQSNDGKALPEGVCLRSFAPMACGDQFSDKGQIELPLENGQASAEIIFTAFSWNVREPFRIEVTPVDEPFTFLGAAEIKIRDVDGSEIIEAPKTLKADGKEKGVFKVRVKDQFGDPVPDYPCFARFYSPDDDRPDLPGRTDQNGVATFEIPPVKRAGHGSVQFVSKTTVANQCLIEWINAD